MEYLVSEEKIRAIYAYRSQRVLDLIKEHDLDFLYLWDYGNTRYAFDVMPRLFRLPDFEERACVADGQRRLWGKPRTFAGRHL